MYDTVKNRGDAAIHSVMKPTFGLVKMVTSLADTNDNESIDEEVLSGLCTDICVVTNVLLLRAFMPEVKLTVDPACCVSVTP